MNKPLRIFLALITIVVVPTLCFAVSTFLIQKYTVDDLYKICLEGHLYYQTKYTNGSIAPVLQDNGHPVFCKEDKRND